MPMHVGGLQLFKKPEGAGPQLRARDVRADARRRRDRAAVPQAPPPLGQDRRPAGAGARTSSSTSSTTSGTARCPSRAGSASCSSSARGCTAPGWPGSGRCGRRTSSRACATAGWRCTPRPTTPWSTASPRCGCCRACSRTDPDQRGMPAPVGGAQPAAEGRARSASDAERTRSTEVPVERAAHRARHHRRGGRHARRAGQDPQQERCATRPRRSRSTPRARSSTRTITGSRRFAAQDWPIERLRAIGKATGTTINDVVLAMCSGAMRTYLLELDALPDTTAGRDGAGRAQGQAVARRLGRGRQRRRRGDGPARHRPGRPRRPARRRSTDSMLDGKRRAVVA